MPNDVTVKIEGLADLKRALADVPNKIRKGALKRALRLAGNTVRDAARAGAPVLQTSARHRKPGTVVRRKPGTVKQAIRVRTSKADRKAGDVGVFVNVKPAKAGQRGAKSPNDPFYWRWLEFGTRKMAARHFLQQATSALPKALAIFEARIAKWINETDRSGQVNP